MYIINLAYQALPCADRANKVLQLEQKSDLHIDFSNVVDSAVSISCLCIGSRVTEVQRMYVI